MKPLARQRGATLLALLLVATVAMAAVLLSAFSGSGVERAREQRTYALLLQVWNDRANAPARPTTCAYNNTNDANYMGRAWSTVIAYMLSDYKVIFE